MQETCRAGAITLLTMMVLAPTTQGQAGTLGWGKGAAASCGEMYSLVHRDVEGFLDRELAEISSLPSRAERTRRRDEHEAKIDEIYDALGAMHRWCEANFARCTEEAREAERRECPVRKDVISYRLESRSTAWEMGCTNDTAGMPTKCAEPTRSAGWERTAVAYGWTGEHRTGKLAIFVTRGERGDHDAALARALSNCRAAGRWACDMAGSFAGRCFSIAHGEDNTTGGGTEINEVGFGTGDNLAAADRAALEHCRLAGNVGCKVWNSNLRKCSE